LFELWFGGKLIKGRLGYWRKCEIFGSIIDIFGCIFGWLGVVLIEEGIG
jgi:hypothetical protein